MIGKLQTTCQKCSAFVEEDNPSTFDQPEITTVAPSVQDIPGLHPSAKEKKNSDTNLAPLTLDQQHFPVKDRDTIGKGVSTDNPSWFPGYCQMRITGIFKGRAQTKSIQKVNI